MQNEQRSDSTVLLAIPGSLRRQSFNRALLDLAAETVPGDVDLRIYEGLGTIPLFNEDLESPGPESVLELRRLIRDADGILIATPEYNHSIPGVLKNAVDWASRPYGHSSFTGKPVAVIGSSVSDFGAAWAQAELRKVLKACAAEVLDVELAVTGIHERLDERGRLNDAGIAERLAEVTRKLASVVTVEWRRAAR